jgi:hypothetical protein
MRRQITFFVATAAVAAGCCPDGGSRKCSIFVDSAGWDDSPGSSADDEEVAAASAGELGISTCLPQNGHSPKRPAKSAEVFSKCPQAQHRTKIDIDCVSHWFASGAGSRTAALGCGRSAPNASGQGS